MDLVSFRSEGLYCPQGDFYIDPWKPVRRAVITHAHSDHARPGSRFYLAHADSYYLLKHRLGEDIGLQTAAYNQCLWVNGVQLSFHPAGHIPGAAQVRLEHKGEVWVVSGDYKLEDDGICTPFEPVRCHSIITESTFGLPIYQWRPQEAVIQDIHQWVLGNREKGRYSVLSAYSLGKSQRIVHALSALGHRFFAHGAIYNMHQVVAKQLPLPAIQHLKADSPRQEVKQGIILMPPSAAKSPWLKKWTPFSLGICSGWMQVRGMQRRRNADAGFVLSDHADWPGLLAAIKATGATRVFATHGYSAVLARYLREQYALDAGIVQTKFGEDEDLQQEGAG